MRNEGEEKKRGKKKKQYKSTVFALAHLPAPPHPPAHEGQMELSSEQNFQRNIESNSQ